MRRAVVAVLALARADEVRFAAKVSSWWNSDVAPTFETLEAVARQHLRKKDYGAFQRATGTSVGELLAGLRGSDANATRDGETLPHEALPVVMSTKKVVPHPLNARGLQAFRALLAIRIMADAVRDSAPPGDAAATWRAALLRDGVVAEAYDPPGGRRMTAAVAAKFEALFRRNFSAATAGGWERAVTAPNDKQHYLHVDTYLPTYKAWIFLNVTVEDGPFAYVRGSHHASVPKLRWLFERTRHLTSTRAMPRASEGIGNFNTIFDLMTRISVVTNAALLVYVSSITYLDALTPVARLWIFIIFQYALFSIPVSYTHLTLPTKA